MAAVTKLLIANRGEIAVRIIRTCRMMGIATVAVFSDADRGAPHVHLADEAVPIGPAPARDSYLKIESLLTAARASGADAVHPGYGFLAENTAFARAVEAAGLTFVGPTPAAIAAMGDKVAARALVRRAGVPVVPASGVLPAEPAAFTAAATKIGFPVVIKAAAGGGGKGMRIVHAADELAAAVPRATREATSAFGDGRIYLERYLERPRHIEVQVFGDRHGRIAHLGERECSIQRRHQKIVEESPSPAVNTALRKAMTEAAIRAARTVDYVGAGTVEMLLAADGSFYFLEMNTRLQVEHPVTELVTGVDLVREQILVARGEPLSFGETAPRGHAIECRLYSEDAARQFFPATGTILTLTEPGGPFVRFDGGVSEGSVVGIDYDPMLAKVAAWGATREEARRRMLAALEDTIVLGVVTNRDFLRSVVAHPAFAAGDTHTAFLDEHLPRWQPAVGTHRHVAALAASLASHAPTTPRPGTGRGAGEDITPSLWESLGSWRTGGGAT